MEDRGKIIIFGSNGMVGRECARAFAGSGDVVLLTHADCDITDATAVAAIFAVHRPAVVINCAGMIDVGACEKNSELARQVNADGPRTIAEALRNQPVTDVTFVQMSTAYVFDGTQQVYFEDDEPNPINVYGATKFEAEQQITSILTNTAIRYYIVRTGWLYSEFKKTFVDMVVELVRAGKPFTAVTDQWGEVTWTRQLAEAMQSLVFDMPHHPAGVYHLTNASAQPVSKYEIAVACAAAMGADQALIVPGESEAVLTVQRPRYSHLRTNKGAALPPW